MNYSNAKAEKLALPDGPDLDLPDWSGMQPHAARLSLAEACRWNEEMLTLFPPGKAWSPQYSQPG